MKKNNLVSGALVLSIGALMAKIFSAVYRIVLTRILGGEGIGVYQLIFPFYSLCVTLATAGIPMAISKVVAKNLGNEKAVLKKCLKLIILLSLFLAGVLALFSKALAILQGYKQISICYLILAPSIVVVGIASVLRGYFQGKHNFVPSAVSNIVEQFIKMFCGIVLTTSLIHAGIIPAVIGAVVAIFVSEVVSLLVLFVNIKSDKRGSDKKCVSFKNIVKDIFPITLTNLILPLSGFLDSVLVVNLLAINFPKNVSVFLYGLENGAVASLVGLPTIFSFAIASVILPSMSGISKLFNKNKKLMLVIKIVLIITIPCVLCFIVTPSQILEVLYGGRLGGYGLNGIEIASKLLLISAVGIVFLAVNQIFSSCLQAVDKRVTTIKNLSIAVAVKIVLTLALMPFKEINIYALAISNTACYMFVMFLNYFEIKNCFKLKFDCVFFVKIFVCSLIFVVLIALLANGGTIKILIAYLLAFVMYVVMLLKTKIFSKRDLCFLKYRV